MFERLCSNAAVEGEKGLPPQATGRAIQEYLAVLDDAAFGAATEVTPKFISPADPAARWTGAHGGQAFFAYATNYLIDTDHAIIVDVEATTAVPLLEPPRMSAIAPLLKGQADTKNATGLSVLRHRRRCPQPPQVRLLAAVWTVAEANAGSG